MENANGRLRRDLPRDLDLDALGDAELQEIILTHNLTPRKCLVHFHGRSCARVM
jgi:transposase, IS30 family